ncbi:TetR family transcriptional regulator [Virgisporangium aurantiacum]|uniref:TetR family transcriptional regulator n=1 Tax=Virgisporangium aurantiacum TaxID=175570 RepID=A0A8J3ZDK5_9ACTN|nr:TetR family transcriptional regulator [Virgisporangium aurantiacum]GIJ61966.1 TetR family transcriptional regulator [Virgisporangium aurantiacum]
MNQPGLRERKKQKTRWAIQEHALRLFAERGYDATTVEQIAEAAEVSPSTFFRYFKTKEEVVSADRYDDLIVAAIAAAPPDLGPLAAMRYALATSLGDLKPGENDQILQRMRLVFSVPALRDRTMFGVLESTDTIAPPLARRLGREPDDFGVRSFVTACMMAAAIGVLAWYEGDGRPDLGTLIDDALAALGELAH